jgi:hypothetical protein
MFGFFEAVYAHLTRNVGNRGDAADAAGSLHSKVKEGRDYLVNTVGPKIDRSPWKAGKQVQLLYGYNRTSYAENTTTDIINLTGPVIILGGYMNMMAAPSYGSYSIKLNGTQLIGGSYDTLGEYNADNWNASSESWREDFAWQLIDAFSWVAYYDGSTNVDLRTPGYATFYIPSGFYVDSSLKFTHTVPSGHGSISPALKYGIYYISANS